MEKARKETYFLMIICFIMRAYPCKTSVGFQFLKRDRVERGKKKRKVDYESALGELQGQRRRGTSEQGRWWEQRLKM